MEHPGLDDLKKYIANTKNPRLSSFVLKHKKYIPGWSMDIDATSSHGLHGAWVERYGIAYMDVKKTEKRPSKMKRFNTVIWNEIYSSFVRRKKAVNTFHEEAIDTLTTAALPAATEVRHLLNPTNKSDPSSSINPNGDDDEHESTQSTDDIHPDADKDTSHTEIVSLNLPLASSSDEPSSTSESSPPTQLSLSLQAPGRDRFFIDHVDISEKFYQMQQYVFHSVKSKNLALESDVHLILSLSSILLLQNNNRLHKAMVPFFGDELYNKIRKHNLDSCNMTSKFPGEILLKTIDIAQSLYDKTTDRCNAGASLLTLASTMDNLIDKRLIVSASQLLQFLPMDATNDDISETTLITRYILPALQPLFDNHERNIRLEFTSTELADKPKRPPSFNGCPDCIIAVFPHQTDDGVNVGYGEVKRLSTAGNHYLVNWDLVRLAVFGKNTIDENKMSGNLSIHVVGPFVTFYLIRLHADGLYIMTELARVQCPMSVLEVPAYLTNFSRLKNVLHVFESFCTPDNTNTDISSWRRDSLLATDVMFILDKQRNRKRKNTTGHYTSK